MPTEEQLKIIKERVAASRPMIKITFENIDNPETTKTFFVAKKRLIEALGMSEVFTSITVDAKDNKRTCMIEELKTL